MLLQNLRQHLTVLLLTLLPIHAFAVTVLTKIIQGPDLRPMRELAFWKEGFLGIIVIMALLELCKKIVKKDWSFLRVDRIDICIIGLTILGLLIPDPRSPIPDLQFLYGFRYTLLPLCLFFLLRRVPWSEQFQSRILTYIKWIGFAVALYGIITFFLAQKFFVWLGYTDLVSLYLPWKPIAAYQEISDLGLRRIQSTLSGPNQLGVWLLLPWSIWLTNLVSGMKVSGFRFQPACRQGRVSGLQNFTYTFIVLLAIGLTFSRSAWIATAVITLIALYQQLPKTLFRRLACTGILVGVIGIVLGVFVAPQTFIRLSSSREHLLRPLAAIERMAQQPLGYGLGTAGPATNRLADPCVYLNPQDDYSWAHDRPELCVFIANTQVKPTDRTCTCPFLPENWYLQVGVELGILGMALFIGLMVLIIQKLTKQPVLYCSFIGVSIAALFLHAWEDPAIAYTLWLLCAAVLAPKTDKLQS